jgi:hypothetical protein
VLYDAAGGQARMLGGGFIRSAVSLGDSRRPTDTGVAAPLAAR